jgi:bifunctional DNA-binding transcriptional regulator/antitoxin component of YhaV-PrlF toxin-antitoxin module
MSAEVKDRERRRGRTRVSSKHQITLPVAALAEAHIDVGDEIVVEVTGDGRLSLTRERNRFEKWIGSAPGLSAAADLESLRDEWER